MNLKQAFVIGQPMTDVSVRGDSNGLADGHGWTPYAPIDPPDDLVDDRRRARWMVRREMGPDGVNRVPGTFFLSSCHTWLLQPERGPRVRQKRS